MQRRMTATLAGEEVTLAATFDAASEIKRKVHDPIAIARDAATEQSLASQGIVYDARFKWDVDNVPLVIHIGMKAAGDKRDLKAVQEMVFDHGLIESSGLAVQFVTILVTPHSEEIGNEEEERGSGE